MAALAALNLSWITADLAVGGAFAPGHASRLVAEHAVGHVIDLRQEACDDAAELAAAGVRFLSLPVIDNRAPSQDQLDAGVAFAEAAQATRGRLLVHCQHGVGRSATLALCVLVHRGFDPLAALTLAKDLREAVSPCPEQYEAWAAWIRRRAAQAAVPDFDAFGAIAYRHLASGS
jgi:protein-tyrosine phosphatase